VLNSFAGPELQESASLFGCFAGIEVGAYEARTSVRSDEEEAERPESGNNTVLYLGRRLNGGDLAAPPEDVRM